MKRPLFDTLLSFLLGFAWALLFLGSWIVFEATAMFGLPIAFLSTMLFMFFSLFAILLLEGLHTYKERGEQIEEQNRLLRRIADSLAP